MCAATDESISTLKRTLVCLSPIFLSSFKCKEIIQTCLHSPPLFFLEVSLSLSLSLSLFSPPLHFFLFLFLSAKASTQKTHEHLPVSIHQNSMVIFLLLFFCQGKWVNIALLIASVAFLS